VLIRIADGKVEQGSLPKKALRLVQDWAEVHRAELLTNWQRGEELLPMESILGADQDD